MAVKDLFNLESIAAYSIAINLTYLNLPNLRFAVRIKDKIRALIEGYNKAARLLVARDDPGYNSIYHAGQLDELPEMRTPIGNINNDGGGVQLFMAVWCTPIWLRTRSKKDEQHKDENQLARDRNKRSHKTISSERPRGTIPVDKVVATAFLLISSFYIYVITAAKIDLQFENAAISQIDVLTNMLIFFIVAPIVAIMAAFAYRRDWINFIIVGVATFYTLYCIYGPGRFSFAVDDPRNAMFVLILCVSLTTLLVLLSVGMYPMAEKHYSDHVRRLFDAAEERRAGEEARRMEEARRAGASTNNNAG